MKGTQMEINIKLWLHTVSPKPRLIITDANTTVKLFGKNISLVFYKLYFVTVGEDDNTGDIWNKDG